MLKDKMVQAAVSAFLTIISSNTVWADNPSTNTEQCYGIAKKGKNDCATKNSSCASSSTQDRQKDAFILLPKGTCERIVGGSITNSSK